MTLFRVIVGEDWRNTKALSNCTSLIQAKEYAKKYALHGWYITIYKATDENPLGELVGRWTMDGLRMKKFYMPGERITKKKNMWA